MKIGDKVIVTEVFLVSNYPDEEDLRRKTYEGRIGEIVNIVDEYVTTFCVVFSGGDVVFFGDFLKEELEVVEEA